MGKPFIAGSLKKISDARVSIEDNKYSVAPSRTVGRPVLSRLILTKAK